MEPQENLVLSPNQPTTESPVDNKINRGKFFLYAVFIIISLAIIWLSRQPQVQATILEWPQHSLWENMKRLVSGEEKLLRGETEGRVNFLLLGQGGPNHDGPYLTDTIIVASLNPQTNQIGLISIPRDLLMPIPNFGLKRINSANAIGEQQGEGQGAVLAADVISQVLDLKIHYYARLDFAGFVTIVDQLGGLPINVPVSFVDKQYPGADYSFMTISFSAGWQIMPGEQALQYVRSRHGNNAQGSDFARAKRQQQVLAATKAKLLSPATFLNPRLALQVYRTIKESVNTNLEAHEAIRLAHILRQVDINNIKHLIFDDSPPGLLKQTTSADGAYLLVPRLGDYSELKAAAADLLSQNNTASYKIEASSKRQPLP